MNKATDLILKAEARVQLSHGVANSKSTTNDTSKLSNSSRFSSSQSETLVYCGGGDKKTAKGKRFNHSFGNARPRNKKKGR
uniref:Uncharacterized protein n=1 Tax=Manihot esculenta TaxID=3983 RepID=A0A2C9VB53_MANES